MAVGTEAKRDIERPEVGDKVMNKHIMKHINVEEVGQ